MGVASAIGGIASAIIGKKSADKAGKQSMAGFNYLKDNELVSNAQTGGGSAQDAVLALLGLGDDPAAQQAAFDRFRDNTGYQFRLDQGLSAIEQSGAARGLLNSGATAKALTKYGQNLGSAEFQNYLNQLLGQQQIGLNSAFNVASQGTTGGANAGQYTMAGGQSMAQGLGSALGYESTYF